MFNKEILFNYFNTPNVRYFTSEFFLMLAVKYFIFLSSKCCDHLLWDGIVGGYDRKRFFLSYQSVKKPGDTVRGIEGPAFISNRN